MKLQRMYKYTGNEDFDISPRSDEEKRSKPNAFLETMMKYSKLKISIGKKMYESSLNGIRMVEGF